MALLFAALLGIVQGLTEFLPISSSAHLILARAFFGWDTEVFGLAFDVACHLGTLVAVLVYFRADLWAMVTAVPDAFGPTLPARQLRLMAFGTLPIVVVGLLWADWLAANVRTPGVTAVTLAAGALGLLVVERLGPRRRDEDSLRPMEAVGFGLAQAAALVPGVSRSGATITFGMAIGLRREAAARFSFLLGVPAILAAASKEALELARVGLAPGAVGVFAVGIVSSAVVGYLTVKYFLRFLAGHRLDVFAWYRLGLAGVVVAWMLAR